MSGLVRQFFRQRKLARWDKTPKDLVILHCFGRDKTLPSGSPYVMKIHSYLRINQISYKIDGKDPFGPWKGKAPWISLNGVHVEDSEHIISHLNQAFNKNLNAGFTPEEIALGTVVRLALEEHFVWGMALERFKFNPQEFKKVFGRGGIYDDVVLLYGGYVANKRAKAQGIGLHSREEIEEFISKNLRAVSSLLGNKKYILGNKISEADCGIFGALSQAVWGIPNSKYEKLVHSELTNLRDYCYRIKEEFYPDWDKLISRKAAAKAKL